jgi:hypothetical protein
MTLLDANTARAVLELINQADETPDDKYLLEEYFKQRPCINGDLASATEATREPANNNFEILGTNASSDDVTFDTTNAGLLLTCDGADDDQIIILPHLDTLQSAWTGVKWGTENQTEWTASIKTGAAVTTQLLWAGLKLTNTPVIATDADQVFFRFSTDDSDTTWHVISSIGGTDTNTTTAVAVAADTRYKFKVKINPDRTASCYINDVLVYTTAALTDDVDFIPYIGVQALDTAAPTLIVHYEKISRILFE